MNMYMTIHRGNEEGPKGARFKVAYVLQYFDALILRSIKTTLEYHGHSFCFTANYGAIFGAMIPLSLYSWHAREDKEESGTRNSILRNGTGGHPLQAIPADRKSGEQKAAGHESMYMFNLTAVKIERVWCEMRESGKERVMGGRRKRKLKGQLAESSLLQSNITRLDRRA